MMTSHCWQEAKQWEYKRRSGLHTAVLHVVRPTVSCEEWFSTFPPSWFRNNILMCRAWRTLLVPPLSNLKKTLNSGAAVWFRWFHSSTGGTTAPCLISIFRKPWRTLFSLLPPGGSLVCVPCWEPDSCSAHRWCSRRSSCMCEWRQAAGYPPVTRNVSQEMGLKCEVHLNTFMYLFIWKYCQVLNTVNMNFNWYFQCFSSLCWH